MATEIERKYLLNDNTWRFDKRLSSVMMEQWYISVDPARTVRVRIEANKAILCIKGKTVGASRREVEAEIPVAEAEQLRELMAEGTQLVEKVRHRVLGPDGMIWEIDEFLGVNAGLMTAEIELDSEEDDFEMPIWVGQDVTNTFIYSNSHLACYPFSSWVQL